MLGVVVDVVVDEVVVGLAVVDVVEEDVEAGVEVVVAGGFSPGAGSLNGTGACGPPMTYTGVPEATDRKNHIESAIGIRTQPCEAG